jgi:hypothetical protein
MYLNNPDATRHCLAKLSDWKLKFNGQSKFWGGCSADIAPEKGSTVIGVVWIVKDLAPLDRQEFCYRPIQVDVESLTDGTIMNCRTYVQEDYYKKLCDGHPRLPSLAYKNVVIAGARESGLPQDYIDSIKNMQDNGVIPEEISSKIPECFTG